MDPLGGISVSNNVYSYAANNWINSIDYKGLIPAFFQEDIFFNKKSPFYNLTKINNDGIVVEHTDDADDKRVLFVDNDGSEQEIGTEIEGEDYSVGERPFFKHDGITKAFYNYSGYKYFTPNTSFDDRFRIYLEAKNVGKYEEAFLDIAQPIIQNGVLMFYSNVSLVNDISTLVYGQNIYGEPTDAFDTLSSIIDIFTIGLSSDLVTDATIRESMRRAKYFNMGTSVFRSIIPSNGND